MILNYMRTNHGTIMSFPWKLLSALCLTRVATWSTLESTLIQGMFVCVFALNYHFNTSFYMYLPAYSIASESARSKVANAVRRGVAAHEIDDVKDTY